MRPIKNISISLLAYERNFMNTENIIYIKNTLNTDNCNVNISIPFLNTTKLVKFNSITYSNGGQEYEIEDGIIVNVDNENTSLNINESYSNLDLMDINMVEKTSSNIYLELSGNNITPPILPIIYPQIKIGQSVITDGTTAIEITSNAFYILDSNDNGIINITSNGENIENIFKTGDMQSGVTSSGIIYTNNNKYSFIFTFNSIKWYFKFGQMKVYTYTPEYGGYIYRIDFLLPEQIIKDYGGKNVNSSLSEFRSTIGISIYAFSIYDNGLFPFENFQIGEFIPGGSIINIFKYSIM